MLPLANLMMAHFVLKKTPSFKICFAILFIVTGCLLTGIFLCVCLNFFTSNMLFYFHQYILVYDAYYVLESYKKLTIDGL